jgi:hypothetical protein
MHRRLLYVITQHNPLSIIESRSTTANLFIILPHRLITTRKPRSVITAMVVIGITTVDMVEAEDMAMGIEVMKATGTMATITGASALPAV